MDAWNKFRNYFIKGSIEATPDIFERARIRIVFTLCFLANILLVLIDTTLIFSQLYVSLVVSLLIHMSVLTCLYLIKFKNNYKLGARITIITVFIGLCLDILFSDTIGLADILWFAALILFTFLTADSKWAAVITSASVLICVLYMLFFFYDNFHDESIYTAWQMVPVLLTITFGFTIIFSFVREARLAEMEAEIKLKENFQEQKNLNVELERVNGELKAANKNLETFSYSVSHDLRAPLRAILAYSGILSEKYETALGAEGLSVVGSVVTGVKKMNLLINDLLDLSLSESRGLSASEVDMVQLVREVISDYEKSEGSVNAEINITELPKITGDRFLLKQVWTNLFSNAIKYSSGKEKPRVEIGSRSEGGKHVFYVKDNGAGFDMKYYDKLFNAFQRLHSEEEFKGTGVGLAIVKKIVTRHRGRVWAESTPGEGATFYFSLPA